MGKERLAAFTDAVLAIVMTVLVLELPQPQAATLAGLWELRVDFLAYALSFMWLGTMWINIHHEWDAVEKISPATSWASLIMLFFASFFPWTTAFVSDHVMSATAQVFYGVVVLAVTASNLVMYRTLVAADPANPALALQLRTRERWMAGDVLIKVAGMVVAALWYPPAMMIAVLLAGIVFAVPAAFRGVRRTRERDVTAA
ncbi:TMEM175 family protein [Actinomyces glycerinitolerans]|uniref:Endosomal/lysomomal potassium channel tmem175 n=1 Tax=Actinomyces glycerinitolerans TaxID=1892869 RepID=A0A1M4RVY0_9ACTO|nr:TMEM175 family protein [Actinomyces glycerinitolerans]SHE24134.1 endosomal/lysomomal potassium channel tmem175 [Actinomyces glycerinitolerans]